MFKNYFKIAVRNLLRHKGYSVINIVGLAVGIACCTLIMLYVYDDLSFEQNHQNAGNIYRVTIEMNNNGIKEKAAVTSAPIGPELKKTFPEVKDMVRISNVGERILIKNGENSLYEKDGIYADSTLFNVFTYPLAIGNPKMALTNPNSIVLSQEMARKYFGDENPMGKVMEIELDNFRQVKVTGVLAPVPGNTQIRPYYIIPFHITPSNLENWWAFGYYTFLLVNDNFNAKAFAAKLSAFGKKHLPVEPGTPPPPVLQIQPLLNIHMAHDYLAEFGVSSDIKNIYLFTALAVFIILLACINFMNLATARSQNRAKEVGVRKVIGATRRQLISQFLSESVILSVLALVAAIIIVQMALPAFNQLSGKMIGAYFLSNYFVVSGFLALTLLVGLAAGLYPAFFLSAFKPVQVLKGGGATGTRGAALRKGLVILQFAISIGLIVGTAVVYSQMQYLQNKRLGFNKEQLLSIPLTGNVPVQKANTLKNEFLQIPGVTGGAITNSIPGAEGWWRTPIDPLGSHNTESVIGFVFQTDYDFFRTMGIENAAGRRLDKNFAADSARSVMLNEAAVKAFGWTSPEEAIGKKVSYNGDSIGTTVVGVVKDFNYQNLRAKVEPAIFALIRNNVRFLVLRISPDHVAQTLGNLNRKWSGFDAAHPFSYSFVDENLNNQYQAEMRLGKIFGVFSSLAIFIACLGLFGLASFTTEQRTKEIGIRKVLGASVAGIVNMLSKDFLKLVLIANIIAWPIAWYGMNQWLQDFEYRTAISWWIFGASALVALLVALLTVSFHAVKAALSNPVAALRSE